MIVIQRGVCEQRKVGECEGLCDITLQVGVSGHPTPVCLLY